jgi:hypothetical protein
MPKALTYLRLPLLALLTSVALTSCFCDKKNDPKPKPTICPMPAPTPTGGNK